MLLLRENIGRFCTTQRTLPGCEICSSTSGGGHVHQWESNRC